MKPTMHGTELALFEGFVKQSKRHLEFGAGANTIVAAQLVNGEVTVVDSSAEALAEVRAAYHSDDSNKLITYHVDIGPVGEWGAPIGEAYKSAWPKYSTEIWNIAAMAEIDTMFIDGRFRVACALQALLATNHNTIILIHDFGNRTHYHEINKFGKEIIRAGQLSAFVRMSNFSAQACRLAMSGYLLDPR
jgi:hypothetical protein